MACKVNSAQVDPQGKAGYPYLLGHSHESAEPTKKLGFPRRVFMGPGLLPLEVNNLFVGYWYLMWKIFMLIFENFWKCTPGMYFWVPLFSIDKCSNISRSGDWAGLSDAIAETNNKNLGLLPLSEKNNGSRNSYPARNDVFQRGANVTSNTSYCYTCVAYTSSRSVRESFFH